MSPACGCAFLVLSSFTTSTGSREPIGRPVSGDVPMGFFGIGTAGRSSGGGTLSASDSFFGLADASGNDGDGLMRTGASVDSASWDSSTGVRLGDDVGVDGAAEAAADEAIGGSALGDAVDANVSTGDEADRRAVLVAVGPAEQDTTRPEHTTTLISVAIVRNLTSTG
jgi:hypothetical protein